MNSSLRAIGTLAAAAVIFASGVAFGTHRAAAAAAAPVASQFGQPKTIIQVSLIKWREGVSDAQAQQVLDALRTMAAQIPGIKNIWMKPSRMEPQNFDAAFVIEFVNRAAADRYAESPLHEAWSRKLQAIRETSISPQITN